MSTADTRSISCRRIKCRPIGVSTLPLIVEVQPHAQSGRLTLGVNLRECAVR